MKSVREQVDTAAERSGRKNKKVIPKLKLEMQIDKYCLGKENISYRYSWMHFSILSYLSYLNVIFGSLPPKNPPLF